MDDRLKLLDRLEPPDQWDEIQHRIPMPERQTPAPLGRRLAAIAAAAVLTAGIALAVVRIVPDRTDERPGGETPRPVSPTVAPSHSRSVAPTPTPTASPSGSTTTSAIAEIARLPGSGTLFVGSDDGLASIAAGERTLTLHPTAERYQGCCGISISPDGTEVAYGAPDANGHSRVQIVNVATGEVVMISPTTAQQRIARDATWSPDGTAVVSSDGRRLDLYSLHGNVSSNLTDPSVACVDSVSAWSGASAAIAFYRECADHVADGFYVMATTASDPVRVHGPLEGHGAPTGIAWSPDGTELAAETADGVVWLVSVRAADAHAEALTKAAPATVVEGSGTVAWSPDGGWIAFVRSGDVRLLAVAGGRVRTLAATAGLGERSLSWTPAS